MTHLQIAVDCTDPHPLADWWAETLGWIVEPSDEDFIRSMIDQGYATEADTVRHNGQLVWRDGAAICPADQTDDPRRPRMLFQPVPEPKGVKNRVHWDVRLDGEDLDAARARLEQRGATYLHDGQQGPHRWLTLADPEGNEFCIG